MVEINPRIYALGFLFFVAFAAMYGTPYLFPHEKPVNTTPNVTIIYRTVEKIVLVTPTPDGHTYFASEYQNGTRLLQRSFSWIRNNAIVFQNANSSINKNTDYLGQAVDSNPVNAPPGPDMKVTTIVYDYKYFDKLHVFDPTNYKYSEVLPEENKKFLFIFVYMFMDDIIGDDVRMWAVPQKSFAVYDGVDTVFPKVNYHQEVRYKELEETWNFNNDHRVTAYKFTPLYSSSSNHTLTAGEYGDEAYYLRGGMSNAIDGYIIFEVNKKSNPENSMALANFYTFGYSNWKLKT